MAILRVGWGFWRSLSKGQQEILLDKYEVHTVSDATYRAELSSIQKVTNKAKE